MKRIVIIMLAAIITACGDERVEKMLRTAESVIDCRPDSAMTILKQVETSGKKLVKRQRMKHLLLKTIAMDKLDISLDTITYMDEVAEYYSGGSNHGSRIKAYYMAGGVYRDRGNAPKALECYRKAVADTTHADCDFKTLSRVYGQIASLFYNQLTPELAHKAELKAVEYAEKAKDTIAAIIFYEHLGTTYRMMGKYDSTLLIVNNAYQRYKAIGQDQLAAGALTQAIEIYLLKGQYSKAKKAMDEIEQNSGLFDDNGDIIKERVFYYRIKGSYYEGINKNDSALSLYRKLIQYNNDINDLEAGYHGLMSVYKKIGIADSTAKYAELFAQTNDSSSFLSSSENIIKMQALYDYTENQQIAEAKTLEAERYKYIAALFSVIFLAGIYIIYIGIRRYRQKKNEETAAANKKYFDTLSQLDKAETEAKMLRNDFAAYKKAKDFEVDELRQAMTMICKENDMQEICTVGQALLNCAIIRQMHDHAVKIQIPSAEEWNELYRITEENIPLFYERINDEDIKLTSNEKSVCILTRFQFTPNETSLLMNLTKQRITNIRSNINKKLFNCEGTKSLNHNIKSI